MGAANWTLNRHLVVPVADGSLDNIALTFSNVILSQLSALEERKRAPKVLDTFTIFLQLTIFKPCINKSFISLASINHLYKPSAPDVCNIFSQCRHQLSEKQGCEKADRCIK